jgi:hypothetical protein
VLTGRAHGLRRLRAVHDGERLAVLWAAVVLDGGQRIELLVI